MSTTLEAPPTVTLAHFIRELDLENPEATDAEIAVAALDLIALEAAPLSLTTPAVTAYACTLRRNRVSGVEKRLAGVWDAAADPLASRREAALNFHTIAVEMADSYIAVRGVRMRAGEMTREDWRERIAEMTEHHVALGVSIARAQLVASRLSAKKPTLDAWAGR